MHTLHPFDLVIGLDGLEQPPVNLIICLESVLVAGFLSNQPVSLQNCRQVLVTSRAKNDTQEMRYLAE